MPPLMSSHPKRKKKSNGDEWVVVGSFAGLEADMDADACVVTLEGHEIPAVRLPTNTVVSLGGLGVTLTHPVRVLVPPDRETEARELLGQIE